ncbi:MAG TPA: FAD-dependent oxidoreductase [Microlunatus sp.]
MSRTATSSSYDVLVVGAGPAGLTAAITLARQGADVLIIEKHRGTSPFPKATGVSTRTMELLRIWGIDHQVRAGAMPVQPTMSISETLRAPVQASVPFGYPTDDEALAISPVTPAVVPQDHLEPVLVDHLIEHGGTVRFRTELTALQQVPFGMQADILDHATGRRSRIHATYVIGADGPRSNVRAALGINVDDLGSIGDFVSVTFRADLTRMLGRTPSAINAVTTADAAGLFVPTSADDRWIYAREWQPGPGDTVADWTSERITTLLRAGTGLPDLVPEIIAVMPFEMAGHVATTFRAGPAFLVGDAAHRTTPVGGTGMNTAIHGAHNLAWKLAWVLRGWAGDSLLDSYELERRPIGEANVRRSLVRGPQPPADGLSWDTGVHYTSPVIASGGGTGQRAPHVWIRYHGARVSTVDLFDGRLTVITGPSGHRWRRAAEQLAAEGLPIAALISEHDVSDDPAGSESLASRYQLGDSGAALIRPDGYLAWHRSAATSNPLETLRSAVDVTLSRSPESAALSHVA